MKKKKVCVLPCSGMGKVLGSVTREVGFIVAEDLRSDDAYLVCVSSLSARVGEYAKMIKTYPTIVIDGCFEKCASKIAAAHSVNVKSSLFLPRSIKKYGIKPKKRDYIGTKGIQLAEKVAQDVVKDIDKLLGR
ncbi:MAG: putative zinc-binding protein [Candidatus Bathyarchaeota archaeon]|nr:putative zinc-binding protein [Candidatus Bathyarchaeota archaeon]